MGVNQFRSQAIRTLALLGRRSYMLARRGGLPPPWPSRMTCLVTARWSATTSRWLRGRMFPPTSGPDLF